MSEQKFEPDAQIQEKVSYCRKFLYGRDVATPEFGRFEFDRIYIMKCALAAHSVLQATRPPWGAQIQARRPSQA